MKKILIGIFFCIFLLCACDKTYYYELHTKDALNVIEISDKKEFKAENDSAAMDKAEIILDGYIQAHKMTKEKISDFSIVAVKLDVSNSEGVFLGSINNKNIQDK